MRVNCSLHLQNHSRDYLKQENFYQKHLDIMEKFHEQFSLENGGCFTVENMHIVPMLQNE